MQSMNIIISMIIITAWLSTAGCALMGDPAAEETMLEQEREIETLREREEELEEQVKELKSDRGEKKETAQDLEEEKKELESDRGEKKETAQELEEQTEDLKSKLSEKEDRVQELEEQIAKLKAKEEQLEQLREENKKLEESLAEIKEAETRREGEEVIVTLDSEILFDLGDHELRKDARESLDELAEIIAKHSDRPIVVEGHTDTVPVLPDSRFPTNWHLSAARAVSVVQYLTAEHGLPEEQFFAGGYGEHRPASSGDLDKNRRVEISFLPPELEKEALNPED